MISNLLSKNKIKIALIIILVIGAFLRLYRLETFMDWFTQDSARDVLVAKHMVDMGEFSFISPIPSHGLYLINNSPLYYFLLAGLWMITRSPVLMTGFFALMGILSIYLAFEFGKTFIDEKFGLILAFLTAISSLMINDSRFIYQANLILVLTWMIFLSLWKSIRLKSEKWFLIFIFFSFLSLHFHYSIFFIVPVCFWFGILSFLKIKKNKFSFLKIIVLIVIMLGWWVVWTYIKMPFDQVKLIKSITEINIVGFVYSLDVNVKLMWQTLLPGLNNIGFGIALAFIFIGSLFWLRKRETKFVFGLILSLLISGFIGVLGSQANWLYVPMYMALIIIFAYVIYRIYELKKMRIIPIFLMLILIYFLSKGNNKYFEFHSNGYQESGKVAKKIIEDYGSVGNKNNSFIVWNKSTGENVRDYWFSPSIWYFLEKYLNKKLVSIVPWQVRYNNVLELENNPEFDYLVCSGRVDHQRCQYLFEDSMNGKIEKEGLEIMESKSWDLNYAVFRYKRLK